MDVIRLAPETIRTRRALDGWNEPRIIPLAHPPDRGAGTLLCVLRRLLFHSLLFLLGLGLGLLGPWVWWLDREAGRRFADRQWTQDSRVYARPLELYAGQALDLADLVVELEHIGLRSGDPTRPGRFARSARRVELHAPAFPFPDQPQAAQRVRVDFEGDRVQGLSDAAGRSLSLVRLPPAELGELLPTGSDERSLVRLADFPPLLVTGIQAVEDRQFRHHHGVDPRGLLRAAWANLRRGGVVQGGSTITQQLVKNLFLSPERSLVRKFNEAVMAISLERRFSKGEILEAYLNEVYLGQDGAQAIHGFGRASEYYFGLPVQSLAPEQIALLVGMVRGASWYHPVRNPERAMTRRNQVLAQFRDTGLISPTEHDRLRERGLELSRSDQRRQRPNAAFLELVARQLRQDYHDEDLRGTGLKIFTTLSPSAQRAAERGLADALRRHERQPGELQGAVILVEPSSGEVRALVGDRQAERRGFNRALDARRSIGSVIKPFVYLQALAQPERYSLVTPLMDAPIEVPIEGDEPWRPSNYDGTSHGEVALMDALAHSYNQATVGLGMELGLPGLFRLLEQLGVDPGPARHPSAFLGALSLTPLQVAQLYQPLAAEGYSTPLRSITQVVDAEGREIGRYPMRLRPIREDGALALLDFALRHAVTDGTARSLPALLHDDPGVRGKTGTTNDRRDAWFVGYTRDWLGVVWTGRDDNAPAGVTGAATALPVWAEVFNALPSRQLNRQWPESLEWFWIDWPTARLANEQCPNARAIPFIAGSNPTELSDCFEPASTSRRRRGRNR
ncbi:penicillin-binding protein 1B [Wenzhouxiangella marina]|uniref:penicillin-binding protein 1B n=1 Tax=Wenzhouxiangella marina TaxID=1579979 RepID=UPI0014706445|nr:penicillin-binding protein 1B [Wenzhouxiangella marina]